MLQKLLLKHFGDEAKVKAFLDDMKASKIFTASEENLDTRYSKLKGDYDNLNSKNAEALTLIEQLKTENSNNQALQNQINEYQTKINTLEAEKVQLAIDNALKVELLSSGAKSSDLDYLMFKAKQGDALTLDKDGNVKDMASLIDGLKKTCNSNFDSKVNKKVDVKDLPNENEHKDLVTKEQFAKMGYRERTELYNNNQELYNQLRGE